MTPQRAFRLRPWLVRALIPAGRLGTYVLHRDGDSIYVGRSDTDLRRRLLEHCATARGDYFTYDVHFTTLQAFEVECSLFHGLKGSISNIMHPDAPNYIDTVCPFCLPQIEAILNQRLTATRYASSSETETSRFRNERTSS